MPAGGILLDDFYHLALEHELAVVDHGRVRIDDPDFLTNTLFDGVRFPKLPGPFSVRAVEGTLVQSGLNPADGRALANGFSAVWSELLGNDPVRRDVVLMQEMAVQVGGSAEIDSAASVDVVQWKMGPDSAEGSLPRLGQGNIDASLGDWASRLQKLIRGVVRTLGAGRWCMEWVDDGNVCWVTFVTPTGEEF